MASLGFAKFVDSPVKDPSRRPNGCFWIQVDFGKWVVKFNQELSPSKVITQFEATYGGICKARGIMIIIMVLWYSDVIEMF